MNTKYCGKSDLPITGCHMHSHNDLEIILQTSGASELLTDEGRFKIAESDIMIIPPKMRHGNISMNTYTDIYVQVGDLNFKSLVLTHDYDGNVRVLMNMLHKAYMEKEGGYAEIVEGILSLIRLYLEKYRTDSNAPDFVRELKNRIYDNLSNSRFRLSEEGKRLGYDDDYLRRKFKKETGETPLGYLTRLRIEKACALLLQDTFISVKNVAELCGFEDCFYFSTCFKKLMGMSPIQFRKSKNQEGIGKVNL